MWISSFQAFFSITSTVWLHFNLMRVSYSLTIAICAIVMIQIYIEIYVWMTFVDLWTVQWDSLFFSKTQKRTFSELSKQRLDMNLYLDLPIFVFFLKRIDFTFGEPSGVFLFDDSSGLETQNQNSLRRLDGYSNN